MPKHKVILEQAYPAHPGLFAQNKGDDIIEVWTCSESMRKYRRVGVFDHLLNQLEGEDWVQAKVLGNYMKMITLKPMEYLE